MKVLVVGNGGREHALAWKLSKSPSVREVLCAPGNAGTTAQARNVKVFADDTEGLVDLCRGESIGLVVIGPEAPLCRGLADVLRKEGIPVFGPGKGGAELEGSKAFAKEIMGHAGVPTAGHRSFSQASGALDYFEGEVAFPLVIKASGLAGGKGAIICRSLKDAQDTVQRVMVDRVFGSSGDTIIVEDFLGGEEVSVHTVTDGRSFFTLPTSQDHKRALDGDQGPNTGGMGAVSPSPLLDAQRLAECEERIVVPTVHALQHRRRRFSGVLYSGLMLTRSGPKVLEYNVRFGDPETQVILPRLRGDLGEILLACAQGRLGEIPDEAFVIDSRRAVTVVMASGGYPEAFLRGHVIEGLRQAESMDDVLVFHGGTSPRDGNVVTAGGRVLAVTGFGADLEAARTRAYAAVGRIRFADAHYRSDIGARAALAEARQRGVRDA